MYEAVVDPYCYPGTTVLKNIPGLRNQAALDRFEVMATAQRSEEALPTGRLSVRHYRAVHHHLFQDIYPWAGKFRTVRISKGNSMFCYPEHICEQMKALFARLAAARYLPRSADSNICCWRCKLPRNAQCHTCLSRWKWADPAGVHGASRHSGRVPAPSRTA